MARPAGGARLRGACRPPRRRALRVARLPPAHAHGQAREGAMTLAFLNGLVDFLTGSDWTYLILFGICVGDAVFPALPSETAAIVCGIQAARGQLSLGLVLVLAAAGAFTGDNLSYCGGRFLGRPVQRRLFSGEK